MRTKLLSALILILITNSLVGQTGTWTRYARENTGLIGQNPKNLVFDKNNNMFVSFAKGAYDPSSGIAQFNGTTWKTYYDPTYTTDGIMSMAIDSNNVLWATMFANANSDFLMKIENGVTTFVSIPHVYQLRYSPEGYLYVNDVGSSVLHKYDLNFNNLGMINPPIGWGYSITDFAFDPADSTLWATTGEGLWHYDGTNWTGYTTGNSGIPYNAFHTIAVDDSTVWMGHNTAGFVKFDKNSTFTLYNTSNSTLPSDQVYSLHADKNSPTLWIGVFSGLVKYDLNSTFEIFMTDTLWPRGYTVNDIEQDNNGKIHITSGMVAASFDGTAFDNVWHYMNTGLPSFYSTYLQVKIHPQTGEKYIGNSGAINLWPGYNDGGLTIFNDSVWTSLYPQNSELNSHDISRILFDNSGNTWLGHNSGLQKVDAMGNWTNIGIDAKAMALDSSGNVWVSTGGGLSKWDGATWTSYTTADGLPANYVEDIDVDHNGVLWIATNGGGVASYDGTSFTVYNSSNSGLAQNIVYEIGISPSNEVYVGTHFGGFQKLSAGTFTNLGTYATNYFYDIVFNRDSTAWIAADNGLWLHHPNGTYTYYSAGNSDLVAAEVYDIEFDGMYKTWLATQSGLYIIDNTPSVAIDTVLGNVFCAADTVRIAYTVSGTYSAGNTFSAVLSDPSGSFASGTVIIGSKSGTGSDTIVAGIPFNAVSGTAYRIMIQSSGPASISTDNGSDLIIHALPSVTVTGDTAFCPGGTATLSTGAFASYLWSSGDTTQSITTSTPGGYYVTVTDSNGCSNQSAAAGVTARTAPSSTITVTGALTFCPGGSAALDAGAGLAGYSWSNGDTSRTITVTSAGQYSAAITDAYGCTGSTDTVTVGVHPVPSSTIAMTGSLIFCQGDSVVLNAGTGYTAYSWSTGDTTQTIKVTNPGNYYAAITDNNGCTGSTDTVTVTVNPLPAPVISGANDTLYVTGGTSYQWYKDGVAISGATSSFFDVIQNGVYTVVVTDANGCEGQSAGFNYNGTGIDAEAAAGLNIFPNPSAGVFTIRSAQPIERIEIFNVAGIKVISEEINSNEAMINMEGYSKGIYFAEIMIEGKRTMKRIILQ